ncbi:hypothetical protein CS542_10765 [Pedobacter sp. IW39]|nr:hypothetical protein CS542_10765 [Pedobacter sp. IW39]
MDLTPFQRQTCKQTINEYRILVLKARTVLPSSSAVNWASMLIGAGPTEHGYIPDRSGSEIPSVKSLRLLFRIFT